MAILEQDSGNVRNPIHIGVDIGQVNDSTCIAVVEVEQRDSGKFTYKKNPVPDELKAYQLTDPVMETHYTLQWIQRLTLGTSYPDVATRIADIICNPQMYYRKKYVYLDQTGVGKAVYDMITTEIKQRPGTNEAHLRPITFTAGREYNRAKGSLGKAFLVSRLQSLLQRGHIHAPDSPEVKAMLEELRVYEIKIDQDGHDTYGAFKTGTHDDMATALGLGVLEDIYALQVTYSERLY